MKQRVLLACLVPLLLVSAAALAEGDPVTWVSFLKAQPGQGEDLTQMLIRTDTPLYDQLIEEGAVLEWGIGMPIVHRGNDSYSHAQWVTFADWSGVDKFMKGFMAGMMSMSEEDREANAAEWKKNVVAGSHSDAIHRSIHVSPSKGRPAYLNLGFYKAKPGHDSEAQKLWETFAAPVYAKLAEEGTIQGYGLFEPEIHGDYSWSHCSWYTMPGLAARDAVDNAFDAAMAARSEDESASVQTSFREDFESEAHFDNVVMIVHYNSAGGGE
ncbi:MAG: hypothetical protein OES47_12555 [Acidobacteriota bacterium]|nr:hypothetical protein [Acidobacteriota bacterium]